MNITSLAAFIAAIIGFWAGNFWITQSQIAEITRLNTQVKRLENQLSSSEKSTDSIKQTVNKREQFVKKFCQSYPSVK